MPANQEEKKVTKPSTDMNTIAYDKMTPHIRDVVNPFMESIKSETTLGTKTVKDEWGDDIKVTG